MRGIVLGVMAALGAFAIGTPSVMAAGTAGASDRLQQPAGIHKPASPGDTITWWCVDLNNLWQVGFPVIAGNLQLDYDIYSQYFDPPFPNPGCGSGFPVVVPTGSTFMPGGGSFWYTNKTYPPAIRAALEARGYKFRSQSPAEDLLAKVVKVRVEVWTLDDQTMIAEYAFDAHSFFRRTLVGFWDGMLQEVPYVVPELGIALSATEFRRLPLMNFAVPAGPLPAGTPSAWYRAYVSWTLSEEHNDGLGLEEGFNFLPAGEVWMAGNRFSYAP